MLLRPGALGDTLLVVPAMRALRRRYPDAYVCLAAHPGVARLLASVREVHQGLAFDEPAVGRLLAGGGLSAPLPERADVVAWTNGPMRLEAYPELGVGRVLVSPSRPGVNERAHCAAFLQAGLCAWGVGDGADDHPLPLDGTLDRAVLVHVGSGSPTKNWPAQHFAHVITLLEASGEDVKLIVGEADQDAAARVDAARGRTTPRLEGLTLADLARHLAGARGYLGNDSGVSHLAGLVGAPTTALFGPTDPQIWAPLGQDVHLASFGETPEAVAAHVLRRVRG